MERAGRLAARVGWRGRRVQGVRPAGWILAAALALLGAGCGRGGDQPETDTRLAEPAVSPASRDAPAPETELAAQIVSPGEGTLSVWLHLPERYKLNPLGPTTMTLEAGAAESLRFPGGAQRFALERPEFPVTVAVRLREGKARVTADLRIYYCEALDEAVCYVKRARLAVPLAVQAGGPGSEIRIAYAVAPQPSLDP